MQNILIAAVVIVVVIGVGYLATNSTDRTVPPTQTATNNTEGSEIVAQDDIEASQSEADTTTEDSSLDELAVVSVGATSGTYTAYDAEKIATSDADHIVLFFHATWCPSCRALDAEINANTNSIPSGVEIYKLDYDTETALKRQYGITTQHSVIEIDSTGKARSAVTHPGSLEALLSTI